MIKTGLDIFVEEVPAWAKGKNLGLLCNQASVGRGLLHARHLVAKVSEGKLKALFSPQHGLYSEKQDNMKESEDGFDSLLEVPVFSLYGDSRIPSRQQLSLIDLLLVDLQDCGTRVYTYLWTMFLAMKACAQYGVEVAVLDRPNPICGDVVEGNLLKEEFFSFVGMAPIPMRHGMTMGELALYLKKWAKLDVELYVIPMKGWKRHMYFKDTGLEWVLPSPNMPRPETALVYPGQVILEGTNLSEGRGTTLPFEVFGAPYLDTAGILDQMGEIEGAILREQSFEPTFNKWQNHSCRGFQLHVLDKNRFMPYRFSLSFLSALNRIQKQAFSWTPPPYEYDFFHLPADLIIGDENIRKMVEDGALAQDFHHALKEDEEDFSKIRREFLLYS